MFVVRDNLYFDKFINYISNSQIKIKYHNSTAKADNGSSYPICVVDDVTGYNIHYYSIIIFNSNLMKF